jgi:hypothetical protein
LAVAAMNLVLATDALDFAKPLDNSGLASCANACCVPKIAALKMAALNKMRGVFMCAPVL